MHINNYFCIKCICEIASMGQAYILLYIHVPPSNIYSLCLSPQPIICTVLPPDHNRSLWFPRAYIIASHTIYNVQHPQPALYIHCSSPSYSVFYHRNQDLQTLLYVPAWSSSHSYLPIPPAYIPFLPVPHPIMKSVPPHSFTHNLHIPPLPFILAIMAPCVVYSPSFFAFFKRSFSCCKQQVSRINTTCRVLDITYWALYCVLK